VQHVAVEISISEIDTDVDAISLSRETSDDSRAAAFGPPNFLFFRLTHFRCPDKKEQVL
jgi:hypothetical protein